MTTQSKRTIWILLIALTATLSLMLPSKSNAAVLDLQVGALSDDGYEYGDTGEVVINDPDENKIYSDTTTTSHDYRYGGFRWTGVTIPQGATINVAYISVFANSSSHEDLDVDIHFQAADNPGTFTTGSYNISSRPRTTASIPWVATLPVGFWYNSPSIVSVVQEIVDRGTWSPGNAMAAIFVPRTDSHREFRGRAYENPTPGFGARLHIEYTDATPLYRSVGITATALASGTSFPVVQATNTSYTQTAATSHTVNLPTGIQSGDLLIALFCGFMGNGSAVDVSWPTGWTEFFEADASASTMHLAVAGAYRLATGSEGGSITVTTNVSVVAAHNSYRISGTADPASQAPEATTISYTDTATGIDPPSNMPTGGAKDYLWLAVAGWRRDGRSASVDPTNYTNPIQGSTSSLGASGTRLRSLRRQLHASSDNPSTFTLSGTSERRIGVTIAVHPIASTSNGLTISGSTATFDIGLPDNIGVGDAIQYDSDGNDTIDALAFIHGRVSSTQYTVKDKNGNTPTAVTSDYNWTIYRAYTSLANWESQTENPNITEPVENDVNPSMDLVSANTVLNVACYGDGEDTTQVTITGPPGGWTTGANNYIKIYTPYLSYEVGASQRHNGKWDDTKYRLKSTYAPIDIGDGGTGASNVWIDGLQIKLDPVTGDGNSGIIINQTNVADHRISNNIVRSVTNNTYSYIGMYMYAAVAGSTTRVWNNIVYDFPGTYGGGIGLNDSDSTSYVYSNTVYNCAYGFVGNAGTVIAKNNISYNNTDNYYGTFDGSSTNNLSGPSQTDAPGSNPRNGVTVTFVDASGSPRDLHLASSDAGAMESGADLSADANLPFSDDIDGQSRPFGSVWDIGADEYVNPTFVKLISFTATQYSEGILLRWKTGYEVNNLGFHVYREENGQLVRLTPEPVAGSALLAGSRTALTAGHHYHWWDMSVVSDQSSVTSDQSSSLATRHSTLATSRYWLKDIDLNGKETMHGPAEMQSSVISDQLSVSKGIKPELLSEIGWRLQERYHHYWKVRELKEKLKQSGINKQWSMTNGQRALRLRSGNRVPSRISPKGLEVRGIRRELDPSSNEMQKYLAGRSAVKLLVREEGWYRVTQSELVAAGLSSRVDHRYLQVFAEGREQAIRVTGGKDGRFGPQDAIEFYGVGLDTPSTDTRVYWLVEGTKPGKRIREFKGYSSSLGSLSSLSYPHTIEKKERRIYFGALKNGDEGNFFGPLVYPAVQVDQLLEIRHLDPGALEDALLEVALQGVTTVAHRVKVLVNETEVGEVVFEGQSRGFVSLPISQSLLEEGENVVTLEAWGGEMDASVIETIRLTYWHTYTVEDNGLRFKAQGGERLSIEGFRNSGIRAFDITDSNEVIEVIGKVESQKGSYAVSFRVPETGQRTLMALTEERLKTPEAITSNSPSSWHQVKEGYDLVMISHRDFVGSLDPLRKLRESQGLRVALIDIEDLYDEFSFGVKGPGSIKDFLNHARTKWRKPPRFVLLVGDASYDPRNYLGQGDFDLLPTKLVDTAYFETASDDWFVDFDNDGLPEMAVGRLPVQTPEETTIMVSKIVGYEKSGAKREALLVSDRVERSNDFDFERASEEVRGLLPSSLRVRKIYRGQFSSDAQANGVLLSAINQGPLLVNYIGHGSIGIWNGILSSGDLEYLTNIGLPFFVGMTCLNGHFQDVYMDSLAESLMKAPQGGAVAVWTSSGLTEPDKQALMNKELIKLLFFNTNGGQSLTLGEATVRAKASVSDQDIRRTWILFGDPTTKLK